MNWLFWKEYRQNRVIVITLLVMLVVPYLFGFFDTWYEWHQHSWQKLLQEWRRILVFASLYSLGISQVALALIGGNAIAGERADRSAEFQVYLPLTREKILAGKLLLVLTFLAVIWLINPLVVWNASSSADRLMPPQSSVLILMMNIATTGSVFFCVAWFFSTVLCSPTFSVAAGLMTPLIIISLIHYGAYLVKGDRWDSGTDLIIQICYVCISLAVALPSFGFGTWLYLRRVEA